MTDEAAAPLDPGASPAPEAAPVAAPSTDPAPRSVAESLAATFDAIQQREGNAPGQRGPDGKFQPREAPVAAAPGTESTDQPATETQEPAQPAIQAPQSWSAEMKAQFAALPPEAQKYVAQRESEAHAKISEQGSKLAAFDGISRVLDEPRRAELMASYGGVEKGLSDLLALHATYHRDPWRVIEGLAQGAGIRVARLDQSGQPAPQAQQADPRIAALSQEVASLKSTITTQALGDAQKVVDAFKADPKHKHYATLEPRIAELLNAGAAKDLPQAYKMAFRENDQLVEQEFAERQAEAKKAADAEAARLATAARQANVVNIRTPGGRASPGVPATVRASLEKAYDRVNGAA